MQPLFTKYELRTAFKKVAGCAMIVAAVALVVVSPAVGFVVAPKLMAVGVPLALGVGLMSSVATFVGGVKLGFKGCELA
jgi:hypothetical protein